MPFSIILLASIVFAKVQGNEQNQTPLSKVLCQKSGCSTIKEKISAIYAISILDNANEQTAVEGSRRSIIANNMDEKNYQPIDELLLLSPFRGPIRWLLIIALVTLVVFKKRLHRSKSERLHEHYSDDEISDGYSSSGSSLSRASSELSFGEMIAAVYDEESDSPLSLHPKRHDAHPSRCIVQDVVSLTRLTMTRRTQLPHEKLPY